MCNIVYSNVQLCSIVCVIVYVVQLHGKCTLLKCGNFCYAFGSTGLVRMRYKLPPYFCYGEFVLGFVYLYCACFHGWGLIWIPTIILGVPML